MPAPVGASPSSSPSNSSPGPDLGAAQDHIGLAAVLGPEVGARRLRPRAELRMMGAARRALARPGGDQIREPLGARAGKSLAGANDLVDQGLSRVGVDRLTHEGADALQEVFGLVRRNNAGGLTAGEVEPEEALSPRRCRENLGSLPRRSRSRKRWEAMRCWTGRGSRRIASSSRRRSGIRARSRSARGGVPEVPESPLPTSTCLTSRPARSSSPSISCPAWLAGRLYRARPITRFAPFSSPITALTSWSKASYGRARSSGRRRSGSSQCWSGPW